MLFAAKIHIIIINTKGKHLKKKRFPIYDFDNPVFQFYNPQKTENNQQ